MEEVLTGAYSKLFEELAGQLWSALDHGRVELEDREGEKAGVKIGFL
jgi:hypothetical protein